ncbi:polyketide cyclase [Afipia massiliensis]|uniref:Polyketide cyclase n=1 Tax=Afipia massiliensis TaxID=211460 RepID=A0A4U6BMG6_9BRAD|nr:SRPBCC family protein [Afipia massiliensis]TKT70605.1 polyketide cyclase [Afipia massiliensis]
MTTLIYIAIVLAVLIAIVLIVAAMRPDIFRVQRSIDINAPAEKIFPLINDYRHWGSWSPYEKLDPAMQRTFSGAPNGKGSVYEWNGNKNVGRGRMEILDATPSSKIVIKLDFFSPFEAHNTAEFTMQPKGNATNVTWAMQGPVPYMMKIMHMFMNMDRMCGDQFQQGLSSMKAVAEK